MTQTIPVPGVSGRWVFGWDAVGSGVLTMYYDDWGNHGRSTGGEWHDGELACVGEYWAFGQQHVFQEVLSPVDEDTYTKRGFMRHADGWVQVDDIRCVRS